jgi:hypothetical protein
MQTKAAVNNQNSIFHGEKAGLGRLELTIATLGTHLAKVGVEGSNPFARSKQIREKSAPMLHFRW